ncbi:Pycsar system effector family protein [Hymenobacter arizonensis]|nr:Pycsar system effector family protein [Hymenobacter arizonensis]
MEEITPDTVVTASLVAPGAPTASPESTTPSAAPALPAEVAGKAPKTKVSALVKDAQAYVTELFNKELTAKLTYHSLRHTEAVVKECRALATDANLSPEDTEALLVAAWFHDTGYLDVYDGHEFRSMERASAWLTERGADAARTQLVQDLIKATHRDSEPETELQKLLTDADMSNLAREDFRSNAELLRTEWELVLGKTYTNPEWAEQQLNFMLEHKYESEAGKERYAQAFKENVAEQRERLKKTEKKKKKKVEAATDTFADPKRGVETMFRTMYNNHMKLSDMADKKASMMISLNAVLLSVIITYLGAKSSTLGPEFTRNPVLAIPMSILLLTSLASVVTAILSAQPDVTSFKWLKKSPQIATNRRVNLLFFGNFTKLSLDNFQDGIRELMRQKEGLYTNMVTDVYYLGEVLSRKYGLLRTSYSVFMVGLILTVLSFIIVLLYKS